MRMRYVAVGLLATAVLTGCGGQDTTPQDGTTSEDQTATTDTSTSTDADTGMTVSMADSDLGQILVDGEGMTLYLFTNDSPGTSVCEGDCLVAWPALEGEVGAGDGVDADLLGTIERSDGTTQAAYGDWPLYYWAQDSAPGDVTGQGVNDVWYVIGADGTAIQTIPGY